MKKAQKRHWFKAKKYGLGWVPVSLEGWLITLFYSLLLAGSVYLFTSEFSRFPIPLAYTFASDVILAGFFLWLLLLTGILLWVCYRTGDMVEWR